MVVRVYCVVPPLGHHLPPSPKKRIQRGFLKHLPLDPHPIWRAGLQPTSQPRSLSPRIPRQTLDLLASNQRSQRNQLFTRALAARLTLLTSPEDDGLNLIVNPFNPENFRCRIESVVSVHFHVRKLDDNMGRLITWNLAGTVGSLPSDRIVPVERVSYLDPIHLPQTNLNPRPLA